MIAYGRSLCLVHFTRYRQLAHYYRYALAHYYHKWVAHSRQWLDTLARNVFVKIINLVTG